jgi:hypothetical protein
MPTRTKQYLVPLRAEPLWRPPRKPDGALDYSAPRDVRVVDEAKGSLLHYAYPTTHQSMGHTVDWVKPFEFTATLTLEPGVKSGRSAKYVMWRDWMTDRVYPMFISEFVTLVREGKVEQGRASGRWTFRKRGQNFCLEWVGGHLLDTLPVIQFEGAANL